MSPRGPFSRRTMMRLAPVVAGGAAAVLAGGPRAEAETPAAAAQGLSGHRPSIIDVGDFVPAERQWTAREGIQAALDAALAAGIPLRFPPGRFRIDRPLVIENRSGHHMGMVHIHGAGMGQTVLEAAPFAGALISVRGVARGPLKGSHFFQGGGLHDLDIAGIQAYAPPVPDAALQHGLEVMAWYGGVISNVRLSQLTGDGIRSIGDAEVDANPDFASSVVRLANVRAERLGGWGFIDDHPIGSPGWQWNRCLFTLCGKGGAWVRSSAHEFQYCGWNSNGYVAENTPSEHVGFGLVLGGERGPTINRIHVVGCEFDSNKDGHITFDYVHASVVERTRFIHDDRNRAGRLTPPVAVLIARSGEGSPCSTLAFRQNLVRLDTPGEAKGYWWKGTANVTDIEIDGLVASDETAGKVRFEPFVGYDAKNAHLINDYRIKTRGGIVSLGRPPQQQGAAITAGTVEPGMWHAIAMDPLIVPVTGWYMVEIAMGVAATAAAGVGGVAAKLALRIGDRADSPSGSWPLAVEPTPLRWRERVLLTKGIPLHLEARVTGATVIEPGGRVVATLTV